MSGPGFRLGWVALGAGRAGLLWGGILTGSALLAGCSSQVASSSGGTGTAPQAVTVTVSGSGQTRLGTTTQFTATVTGTTNTAVTWQVNGVTGGAAATGTISTAGLYTPPVSIPAAGSVAVAAVSQASASASGSLNESLWNPVPVVTSAAATQVGSSGSVLIDVRGSSFVQGAQVRVGGAALTTTYVSASDVQATYTAAAGSTVTVDVLNPNPGSAASAQTSVTISTLKASVASAARLLDQATFGPTLSDTQHVQSVGLDAYLVEQFTTPATVLPDITNPPPTLCTNATRPCLESEWWQEAMTAPDQLRQRVALALAEMFVVSTNSNNPNSIIPYQNLLAADAFGNFSTVMKDVTLSTAMGAYLNMLNSYKPGNGQIANENYSRELMQLFTIGLYQLNNDGTPQHDASGNMIPTYTQAQVQAFARVFTGWTYASSTGGAPAKFPNGTANFDSPMAAVASAHDITAKTLLNGTTLPAGQTPAQDLSDALANIFAHPNVGPFVCRQLIQHLVASNPSPAYVGRVATVFNDNGNGVRGDLRAVVKAILLDPEARAGDTNPTAEGGHLREPMLYLSDVMRGLGFVNTDATGYWGSMSNYTATLGQRPYGSPSVFNFFPPEYVIPASTVNAPEFGLENTASAVLRLTLADQLVFNRISGFKVDLTAASAWGMLASKTGNAAMDSGNLVDALGTLFLHGQMPASMRSSIVNHVATLTDPAQRVRVATYLVITSSQYKILH